MLQTVNDYREILLSGALLMDTRAPIEFSRGSFPGATNLPLMTDDERAQVGTCYKEKGQEAAIALGHQLVAGEVRSQRIDAWAAFARANPEGYLFCFRGGLRSQIVQRWLAETAGVEYRRIEGGYKAMRQFLMTTTETAVNERKMWVVGGMTGTGKTELLAKLPHALDLEGCANHRGSGFGKRVNGQPAQIDFEHQIAIRFLQLEAAGLPGFVVEDEGHFVGKCALPEHLYREMNQAPLVWLEDTFENRVARILRDYVVDQLADHQAFYGADEGFSQFEAHLQQSLANIQKRLGGERYKRASAMLADALSTQRLSGAVDGHRLWIELLLREYYDPMYTHQKASKAGRIIAAGDADKLHDFLLK
jgi:tRNA 2-selenouridine synthase